MEVWGIHKYVEIKAFLKKKKNQWIKEEILKEIRK